MEPGKTNSSRGYFYKNGEIFAVPHPAPKHPKQSARSETSSVYRSSFVKPQTEGSEKMLIPYHPNSIRSRPKQRFKNEAKPFVRKCQPPKSSQFTIKDGSRSAGTQFVTTNKNAFGAKTRKMPTGFNNPGIVAATTTWIHKRQND